jgi:hypothetical protein
MDANKLFGFVNGGKEKVRGKEVKGRRKRGERVGNSDGKGWGKETGKRKRRKNEIKMEKEGKKRKRNENEKEKKGNEKKKNRDKNYTY